MTNIINSVKSSHFKIKECYLIMRKYILASQIWQILKNVDCCSFYTNLASASQLYFYCSSLLPVALHSEHELNFVWFSQCTKLPPAVSHLAVTMINFVSLMPRRVFDISEIRTRFKITVGQVIMYKLGPNSSCCHHS